MNNKLIIATATALALTAGSAYAADLPARKGPPPVYAPLPEWGGFYAGVNAGAAWAESGVVNISSGVVQFDSANIAGGSLAFGQAAASAATGAAAAGNGGFLGGGQIGYNWRLTPRLFDHDPQMVAGFETDIEGVAGGGSTGQTGAFYGVAGFKSNNMLSTLSASRSLDFLGTAQGRIGVLITPTWLFYATAGLAYGGVNTSASIFQNIAGPTPTVATAFGSGGNYSGTRVGWTAGGGVEWMFLPNWSAKVGISLFRSRNRQLRRRQSDRAPQRACGDAFLLHYCCAGLDAVQRTRHSGGSELPFQLERPGSDRREILILREHPANVRKARYSNGEAAKETCAFDRARPQGRVAEIDAGASRVANLTRREPLTRRESKAPPAIDERLATKERARCARMTVRSREGHIRNDRFSSKSFASRR